MTPLYLMIGDEYMPLFYPV
ncbi:hypothetical protein F383_17505 [Gossypium arboreum]|uniref:Uncharacterized protein n=1 Tax=Gossypium arboreum TaxID=29729 RepID=A0A0B0NPS1_GOSAR|nr:hypothetical protein F383_17505 [Gossypium arboreum]